MTRAVAVVDDHPRFYCETVLWTLCTQAFTSFDPTLIFVKPPPESLLHWLNGRGVEIRRAETLLPASPHCNKIIPGKMFPDERIVVTDTDVFMLDDFDYMLDENTIRVPENNQCNPPLSIFETILKTYGLQGPFEPGLSLFRNRAKKFRETLGQNLSCGVIWIPPSKSEFWAQWETCARWLIDNRDVMGPYHVHVDQVALSMALTEHKPNFRHLAAQTNAILQLLPLVERLYAVHLTSAHIPRYPDWFDEIGQLKNEVISSKATQPLSNLNASIREARPILESLEATREFQSNFLNPNWKR